MLVAYSKNPQNVSTSSPADVRERAASIGGGPYVVEAAYPLAA